MKYSLVYLFITLIIIAILIGFFIGRTGSGTIPLGWSWWRTCPRWSCSVFDPHTNRTVTIRGCWNSAPFPNCRIIGSCRYCD